MPVRKTESRLPANLTAADLGEFVAAPDGRCTLVSFQTSPLAPGQKNTYVLFVTDAALAGSTHSYEWSIDEDGAFPQTVQTDVGEMTYQPANIGNIVVTARLLDTGGSELASITILQEIGALNEALETLIAAAGDQPGAGMSNPDVIREVVNGYYSYYESVTLKTPEPGDAFKRCVCSFLCDGALKRTPDERQTLSGKLADALDDNEDDFPTIAAEGVGVCGIRLGLLAMVFPSQAPLLTWTELPQDANQNAVADEQLRGQLANLGDDDKIDLINLARFPKTNIAQCAGIIEALRDKYFAGVSFDDVLTELSGTRQHWIGLHYSTGPIAKS
jgi:hypothetical protein